MILNQSAFWILPSIAYEICQESEGRDTNKT